MLTFRAAPAPRARLAAPTTSSSPLPVTFRHWAGISPYTSACAVAETCVFGKQSREPVCCGPLAPNLRNGSRSAPRTLPGRPFSRSYGANLPSSLTEDRSSTFGVFPLPTSVGVRYGLPTDPQRPRPCERVHQARRGFSRRPDHDATTAPLTTRGARNPARRPVLFPLRGTP